MRGRGNVNRTGFQPVHDLFHPRSRGARRSNPGESLVCRCCFNPRAHAGRDFDKRGHREHRFVSIHAPTRGATRCPTTTSINTKSFNPRAHAGRDRSSSSDLARTLIVSIHAPTRGATNSLVPNKFHAIFTVSIHAPTRGATRV